MKINLELIKKIFNEKVKIIKKEDKKKISRYEEYIPMYDIYSEKIYPINNKNLYQRLVNCHYRFINLEVKNWIENKFKKTKTSALKYNLNIINNYDIDILYETSIKTLYKNSSEIGLQISICKRNSFNKYFYHNKPYYSRDELINLGLNMKVIKEKELEKIDILDTNIHYQICKTITSNDVSFDEIFKQTKFIIDNKLISLVTFYSFMGSYFMNNLLRTQNIPDKSNPYNKMIQKLSNKILESPSLDKEYFIYRFIWDDFFIRNLKVGEIFEDKGFISTTRDPFYSPQNEIKFGVVLAKIKIIPSTAKCLFIENLSMFPKEEEILLIQNSRLKLISKNENFKYYHTNKNYEKNITKKYEFELIGNNYKKIITEDESNNYIDLESSLLILNDDTNDKIGIINNFIKKYVLNSEKIKFDNYINLKWYSKHLNESRKYKVFYHWFDGTDSYELFYKNKNKDGMFFIIYDEYDYPYINIEFGDKMIVNNLNKFYFYDDKKSIDTLDFLFIIELAKLFRYQKFEINGEYDNFSKLLNPNNDKIENDYQIAYYSNLYSSSLYKYLKNKEKFYEDIVNNKIFKKIKQLFILNIGYWKIDQFENTEIPEELLNKFDDKTIKSKNMKDFIIEIIENHFMFYIKIKEYYKDIFEKLFIEFDVNVFCRIHNEDIVFDDIPYNTTIVESDENFKLIFRKPLRRII
jgi:hypothetical protein